MSTTRRDRVAWALLVVLAIGAFLLLRHSSPDPAPTRPDASPSAPAGREYPRLLEPEQAAAARSQVPGSPEGADEPTRPEAARVEGSVRDEAGRPLAGVAVALSACWTPYGSDFELLCTRVTDAEGRYSCELERDLGLSEDERALVRLRARAAPPGFASAFQETRDLSAVVTHLELVLRSSATVSGRVVSARGIPVQGARVELFAWQKVFAGEAQVLAVAEEQTDESGRFSLSADNQPLYSVVVRTASQGETGLALEGFDGAQSVDCGTLVLEEGAPSSARLTCQSGEPLGGVWLLVSESGDQPLWARTDARGLVEVTHFGEQPLSLALGEETFVLGRQFSPLPLESQGVFLRVQVADARGRRLRGAQVLAKALLADELLELLRPLPAPGDEPTMLFRAPMGVREFFVEARAGPLDRVAARLVAGACLNELELRLPAPNELARLVCTARTADGDPLTAFQVVLASLESGFPVPAEANGQGPRIERSLAPGAYVARAFRTDVGRDGAVLSFAPALLHLEPGERRELEFLFPAATGPMASGGFELELDGGGIGEGSELTAALLPRGLGLSHDSPVAGALGVRLERLGEGRFSSSVGLLPGDYDVCVRAAGSLPSWSEVRIVSGQRALARVELRTR